MAMSAELISKFQALLHYLVSLYVSVKDLEFDKKPIQTNKFLLLPLHVQLILILSVYYYYNYYYSHDFI